MPMPLTGGAAAPQDECRNAKVFHRFNVLLMFWNLLGCPLTTLRAGLELPFVLLITFITVPWRSPIVTHQ